ncbi:MAG: dTDP-glucose 4,6-dehydratase [Bacteroidales bacterium]|nr:dTDP-glucose 4,6-dehydratase [Bacteroidales bacterium]
MKKTILITGGAGFIGSHVVRLLVKSHPDYRIVNIDKLTYAGNLENLADIENKDNYKFFRIDITNMRQLRELFSKYSFDGIIHLAAESHVDRSIDSPLVFIRTNIMGTVNLLNLAKEQWKTGMNGKRFYQISTDEVFGSLDEGGVFTELSSYDPRSPYSASKAGADHFVKAYHNTYRLPVVISNCSNNYGPNQFPEKLIPLAIHNIVNNRPVPVYGQGENVRDWLYVEDHAKAIDLLFHRGRIGEKYNIGGTNEWKNLDLIRFLCSIMDDKLGRKKGTSAGLITFVTDRAGHDFRYAIDSSKIRRELSWEPLVDFKKGLDLTVDWYLNNTTWVQHVVSGQYKRYYRKQYGNR